MFSITHIILVLSALSGAVLGGAQGRPVGRRAGLAHRSQAFEPLVRTTIFLCEWLDLKLPQQSLAPSKQDVQDCETVGQEFFRRQA